MSLGTVDAGVIENSIRKDALRALSNKLYYAIKPSTASLIKTRKTVSYPASRADYKPGDVMNFKVSANSYIDFTNSYIRLKFCTTQKRLQTCKRGLEASIFKRFRITAQGGTPIEDLQDFHLWNKTLVDHTVSNTYKNTVLQMSGWRDEIYDSYRPTTGSATFPGTYAANMAMTDIRFDDPASSINDPTGNTEYAQLFWATGVAAGDAAVAPDVANPNPQNTFIIPLHGSGFCSIQQYIPKQIGTLDFDITLEDAAIALQAAAATGTQSYKIIDAEIVLDVVQLSDDISRMIELLSSEEKLTLVYDTYMQTSQSQIQNGTTNITISKYAANLKGVYAIPRDPANYVITADSFASVPASKFSAIQWRFDDLYFPTKPISSTAEAYAEAGLKAWNRFNNTGYDACSYLDFCKNGKYILGVDLERDPTSAFTGMNSRGSRNVTLIVTCAGNPNPIDVTIFAVFTRTLTIKPNMNFTTSE